MPKCSLCDDSEATKEVDCSGCSRQIMVCDSCTGQRCSRCLGLIADCDNCDQPTDADDLSEVVERDGQFCPDCIHDLHWTPAK